MHHARPNRLRRVVAFAALTALLGVVAVVLSQCTMVGDNLTGVGVQGAGPTTCIKACNNQFALLYNAEQVAYQNAKEPCYALPQPDKDNCLAAALATHSANQTALGIAKIECQNNCAHHQGAGSAG